MIRQVIVMNKPLHRLPQRRLQRKAKDGSTFGTTTKINDSAGNKVSIPGGFYVSRFELGWKNNRCVSRKGVQPVTPSQNNAITSIKNSFIKTSYAKTALMNEVVYDMMMAFVNGKRTKGRSTI